MTLEERIATIGKSIRILAGRLAERDFQFDRPSEVLPGPEADTAAAIARIESAIGALPLALKLFWRDVGSVNLCGFHPDWGGCDYPDPLVVFPPSHAIHELDEFLADKEERIRHDFPYCVPIAPDYYHKAGVSGGMWYNVAVPAVADDPPLNDECHRTTFVAYLQLALEWGGFPGLSDYSEHSWPLNELCRGLAGAS